MPKKKRELEGYQGGAAFTRARQQFQVLYEKEGSYIGAVRNMELILWPDLDKPDGEPIRPPEHILKEWCVEVDDGKAKIPELLRRAFLARYDAVTEAHVRNALIENARTSKEMAIQAREGRLHPAKSSQYAHANNATSFMLKESLGKSLTRIEAPRKIAGMKFLAPRKKEPKKLPEPVSIGEFREVR